MRTLAFVGTTNAIKESNDNSIDAIFCDSITDFVFPKTFK